MTGRVRSFTALALLATGLLLGAANAAEPPEPITLKEHAGWVGGVAFSPDGSTLATASADTTVKLWDTTSWKNTATLKGHTDYVVAVAFGPDKKLVSGSFDHTARIWDVESGKVLHTLEGHKGPVLSVAIRQDGKSIATGGLEGGVRFWTMNGLAGSELALHKSWVNSIAFSPNGFYLASASSDATVTVRSQLPPRTFAPQAAEIRSVAFSPDGKLLAAGTRYGVTKVWDVKTAAEVASLKGKGGDVWGIAFSPDGRTLAAADGDWNKPSDIVLWDTTTWNERRRLRHTNEVLCVAFHPKQPILAAGAWDKTVKVWDLTELLKAER